MEIKKMFNDDIARKINGVVKVDQDTTDVLVQELDEYVITGELKKHFMTFFNYYEDSFKEREDNIGVWISGFFGSGKSHFLKMLSYLLENKEVDGKRTVERFRKKFADDPASFLPIDNTAKFPTETILFNIDIEGSINKDKTAVLRVFAKMFYNHLGFYGENLKVAKLEQFIEKQGKTDEFRRVFEEKNGAAWVDSRDAFAFFEDDIVETLQEVLGMSKNAADNWFNGTETVETSIAQLVLEIKEYVDSKPDNFRLFFMADEVGQYVGEDINLLINLQSLSEKIGSECGGKVWIVCTGQEAIDEIIKTRDDQFSRIMARFPTRLSLSSTSVDEVIKERLLKKKSEAVGTLDKVYSDNEPVIGSLFNFKNAALDIKGFKNSKEFVKSFPFVPYQFILMPKVFYEIRRHGNSGKHLSGGERSMLSGFQEAAVKIMDKDEYSLVPFYLFYNPVRSFLESSIKRVIERCERAAADGNGIELQDVNVLKILYLLCYIDKDIKATPDNIVILMADNIRMKKAVMREQVNGSLERLYNQNYIGRTGDVYKFLTDEEQDIQREIYHNTAVDTSAIIERIGKKIYSDIYNTPKYRYGKYDFPFDKMVDNMLIGSQSSGMCLKFLTVATDTFEKADLRLRSESTGKAIVVLADTKYYELIENYNKIKKYVMQRNGEFPESVRPIIRKHQEDAENFDKAATDEIRKAIDSAQFYVDGELIEIKKGDTKSKLDQALEYLVSHVYSKLDLIKKNAETDADIVEILMETTLSGEDLNYTAAAEIEDYLEMQKERNLPTSMADIQKRFQAVPYGWREIDIAAVTALLMREQKITVKYSGVTVQPKDSNVPDLLRKKSEIGKTLVSIRQSVSVRNIRAVRSFMREYFDVMDVPEDEDSLIEFISEKFTEKKQHYESLLLKYDGKNYPDKKLVSKAVGQMSGVLSQKKDNTAFIEGILKSETELFDLKEDLEDIEDFFANQAGLYDSAVDYEKQLRPDLHYIAQNTDAYDALNKIRLFVMYNDKDTFPYSRIHELSGLIETVKKKHSEMLDEKRKELLEIVRQCVSEIHIASDGDHRSESEVVSADEFYEIKKKEIAATELLALLDGMISQIWQRKDESCGRIAILKKPVPVAPPKQKAEPAPPKKLIKTVYRQAMFPADTIETDEDIDNYVEKIREKMKTLLNGCDGIKIN